MSNLVRFQPKVMNKTLEFILTYCLIDSSQVAEVLEDQREKCWKAREAYTSLEAV